MQIRNQKAINASKNLAKLKNSYRGKCNLFIIEFAESKVIAEQKPILASFLDDLQSYDKLFKIFAFISKTFISSRFRN